MQQDQNSNKKPEEKSKFGGMGGSLLFFGIIIGIVIWDVFFAKK